MLQASLKVVGGTHDGEVIPLSEPKFLIGRESDCHLRPNSEAISRHHCAFTVDDYAVRLRDLGSTNGTFVNGERLRGVEALKNGDRVTVGKLEFAVIMGEDVTEKQDAVEPSLNTETAELSTDETAYELPAITAPPNAIQESDTTMVPVPAMEAPAQQPAMPQQPAPGMPFQYPQQQPQAGYFPQGMPYPGQPPMGGYYPQQYPYPYPQPVVMGQPYPQQMPPQQMPQQQMPAPAQPPAAAEKDTLNVRLPDPSATGVQQTAPPATQPQGDAASQEAEKNPSQHAADIIRGHMHRRPE